MGCRVDVTFRRGVYPDTIKAIFISSTEDNANQSDTFIPDAVDGFINELQKTGQDNFTSPGSRVLNAYASGPYSTRLRPVSDLSDIGNYSSAMVATCEFITLDTTMSGSAYQDATVLSAIYASRTGNNVYGNSLYLNSPVNFWQPNWFRPQVLINNENLYKSIAQSNFGNKTNQGDLSIGLPFNRCDDFYKDVGQIKKLEVYAQVGQLIPAGSPVVNYIQRYPVMCIIEFWLGTGQIQAS